MRRVDAQGCVAQGVGAQEVAARGCVGRGLYTRDEQGSM